MMVAQYLIINNTMKSIDTTIATVDTMQKCKKYIYGSKLMMAMRIRIFPKERMAPFLSSSSSYSSCSWPISRLAILVSYTIILLVLLLGGLEDRTLWRTGCVVAFSSFRTTILPRDSMQRSRRNWKTKAAFFIDNGGGNIAALQNKKNLIVVKDSISGSFSYEEEQEIPVEWRGQVLNQLKSIIDPDLGTDIVSLGFIQDLKLEDRTRTISFNVELTTPACPVKDQFAMDCDRLVKELSWVSHVNVTMTSQSTTSSSSTSSSSSTFSATYGMRQVGAVIAVSSCKGGVGKSTTAVNLAYTLQSLGASVGIFDADVYGPSLPTMVKPDDDIVRFVGRQIAPLQRNGVQLMSFGYVNEGSAVMRGPMVTQLLDQFLNIVLWGSLDYLIIDMPPGTGDIPLTLTQRLNITAAVIVTTPQELSFVDVVRGVEMFDSVQVPCVAVVENMAYYELPTSTPPSTTAFDYNALKEAISAKLVSTPSLGSISADQLEQLTQELVETVVQTSSLSQVDTAPSENKNNRIPIFGTGHKRRLSEQWGIDHTYSIPLLERIAAHGDNGTPFVLAYPNSTSAMIYKDLAKAVVTEVSKIKYNRGKNTQPQVEYESGTGLIRVYKSPSATISASEAAASSSSSTISPAELRRGCRCAACVEEMTGRQILVVNDIPESIRPLRMNPTGNYAVSVDWSDGHRSLYPYRQIRSMIQDMDMKKDGQNTKKEEESAKVTAIR